MQKQIMITEILMIYLALSLSAGIVTFWTVLWEVHRAIIKLTGESEGFFRGHPILNFVGWVTICLFLFPVIVVVAARNNFNAVRIEILMKELQNRGFDFESLND